MNNLVALSWKMVLQPNCDTYVCVCIHLTCVQLCNGDRTEVSDPCARRVAGPDTVGLHTAP